MARLTCWKRLSLVVAAACVLSCRSRGPSFDDTASYAPFVQQIEYPDVEVAPPAEFADMTAPPSVRRPNEHVDWPLTLDEAIAIALSNNRVIREVGGRIVSAPAASSTIYDPAITETSPQFGTAAALAAFDAQFNTSLQLGHEEQTFNNVFFGGGSLGVVNRTGAFRAGISKTAATGTEFTLENTTDYLRNGIVVNRFPSVYDTTFRGGFRHPLLQGGGIEFNRIAGPRATPGNYNGIVLARINSDITLADFEAAVRDLLRDVESTYWRLYSTYRNLDALIRGRNDALEDWRLEKTRREVGSSSPDQEALALQQYYGAQILVENALSGAPDGRPGVYSVERNLRYLLGLPPSDGRLIRPATRPAKIDFVFDWCESLNLAHRQRVELRRQRWLVKQRELELVASRSFQRMRVDLVGQYYFRGFGDVLVDSGPGDNSSAFKDLLDANLQGWLFGVEVATPVGNRIGHSAVRHAELQLVREKALLDEQQRRIAHDLSAAFVELDRAYQVSRTTHNRRVATERQLAALREQQRGGALRLDFVLDAQRRAVESEIDHYQAIVDYNIALVDLNFARGTLLDSMQVALAEGPWPDEAYRSAAKQSRRFRQRLSKRGYTIPCPVSRGPYGQASGEAAAHGSPPAAGDNLTPNSLSPHSDAAAYDTQGPSNLPLPGPPAFDQPPGREPFAELYDEPPLAAPSQPPAWLPPVR